MRSAAPAPYSADSMSVLRHKTKTVGLVGLASRSKVARQQVCDVLERARPDLVVVGECPLRFEKLRRGGGRSLVGRFMARLAPFAFRVVRTGLTGPDMTGRIISQLNVGLLYPDTGLDATMAECKRRCVPVAAGGLDHKALRARLQETGALKRDTSRRVDNMPPPVLLAAAQLIGADRGLDPRSMRTRADAIKLCRVLRMFNPAFEEVMIGDRAKAICKALWDAEGKMVVAVVNMMLLEAIESEWARMKAHARD